jgi:transmembrane sensor
MDRNAQLLDQVSAEAAEWFVRLQHTHEPARTRADFIEWLLRSPLHVEEYLAITRVWGDTGLASDDVHAIEKLIADATAEQGTGNVVRPEEFRGTSSSGPAERRRLGAFGRLMARDADGGMRRRRYAALAAVLMMAIAGLGWFAVQRGLDSAAIRTAIGEQRSVTLSDGSVLTLNTNSQVRLKFAEGERRIDLLRGEARFKVAKDPQRPFIVTTPHVVVRALGTVFNVYAAGQRTEVAVLEGRIELRETGKPARSLSPAPTRDRIELTAGQQAAVAPDGDMLRDTGAPLERVSAWTERRLIFRGEPLADVVAEFNRYHARPIRIEHAPLASVRISGTFDSSDRSSLLQYLQQFEHVRVEEHEDATHLQRGESSKEVAEKHDVSL